MNLYATFNIYLTQIELNAVTKLAIDKFQLNVIVPYNVLLSTDSIIYPSISVTTHIALRSIINWKSQLEARHWIVAIHLKHNWEKNCDCRISRYYITRNILCHNCTLEPIEKIGAVWVFMTQFVQWNDEW